MTAISEAQLARLELSGRAAWVWDPAAARIVWATSAAARLWRAPSVLGLIDRPFGRLDPARADMMAVAEATQSGGRIEARIRHWASDGRHTLPVEGQRWPLGDASDGVLFRLDTARGPRASTAPLASEESDELDSLLGPFPLAIALFSPRGPCVYANPAFETITGESTGPTLIELAGSEHGAARLIRAVLKGRTLRISPTLRRKGKEMSFDLDAARVVDPRTQRDAILVQLENVTPRLVQERRMRADAGSARALLESVVEGWVSLDARRRLTGFGGRGLERCRARLDNAVGRPWADARRIIGLQSDADAQKAAERLFGPRDERYLRVGARGSGALWRTGVHRRRTADGGADGYHLIFQSADDLITALAKQSAPPQTDRAPRHEPEPQQDAPDRAPAATRVATGPGWADQSAVWLLSPIPLIAHDNFEIVFANDAAARLFGRLNAKSLLGTPFLDLFPDDEERASRHFDALGTTAQSASEQRLKARRPGGKPMWLDAAFQRTHWDGRAVVLAAMADVSKLAAAEAEAQRQEILSDHWFEDAPVPLLALDEKGVILKVNRAGMTFIDLSTDQMIGQRFESILPAQDRSAFEIRRTAAARAQPGQSPVVLETKLAVRADSPKAMSVALGKSTNHGPPHTMILVLIDRQGEAERSAALASAAQAAEDASRKKTAFLADVSHEMRTPLNAILGFTELMKERRLGPIGNERYAGYIDDIHMSGRHLLSLVNDLLDMSKIEAGEYRVSIVEVDPAEASAEVVRILHPLADKKQVKLVEDCRATGVHILADQRSLRQIIINLLSNAVKFTPPGGTVRIILALDPIGNYRLTVEDTGIGMSQEELATAMQPFRQIRAASAEDGGTGLGLPLAKALSEANRASFHIESAPGRGTRVEVLFPAGQVVERPDASG